MSVAHEISWAAGFFDGEGFVSIQKRKHVYKTGKTYTGHYLRIGINHVAPEPLQEMQRLFGGTLSKSEKVVGNRKPRWRWQMNCSLAADALKRMLPYFKNKNKAAELGLELHNSMSNSTKELKEELIIYRELLKEKLINLNAQD